MAKQPPLDLVKCDLAKNPFLVEFSCLPIFLLHENLPCSQVQLWARTSTKNKHPNELRDAESKQTKINELLEPRLVKNYSSTCTFALPTSLGRKNDDNI